MKLLWGPTFGIYRAYVLSLTFMVIAAKREGADIPSLIEEFTEGQAIMLESIGIKLT